MAVSDAASEEIAVRQRLDTFKLGKCMPPLSAPGAPRPGHRHQRSHSRNASISSSQSLSLSLGPSRLSGLQEFFNFSFGGLNSASSTDSSSSISSPVVNSAPLAGGFAPPSTKRNSHHRRRSSVSTRTESAELMGVSVPDLPPLSDDNVNFGEKDSVRRRALWALEGKSDVSFAKVEIPELSTPDIEKMMFDFSTKSNGPSTGLAFGNPMMGSKRDSFKLLSASSSSKDQLHTLVEEEEEEEEPVVESPKEIFGLPSPASSVEEPDNGVTAPSIPTAQPVHTAKPRPATLNLRPLSLIAGSAVPLQGLPTPTLTPSPRAGLRSLSLSPSTSTEDAASLVKQSRRSSLNFSRRPRLDVRTDSIDSTPPSDDTKSNRRSSISYKNSFINAAGLPTPEMTPTFSRQFSLSDKSEEEFFLGSQQSAPKPLSASEQHFLLKSHNALVARITDLEKALSRRMSFGGYSNGSRPNSVLSDVTSASDVSGEPTDEMLSFVRDLKSERDELKKDVEGWRTRVNDLERQQSILAKRVETERWEAWAARSRVGILEAEKGALEKRVETFGETLAALEADKKALQNQNQDLMSQNEAKAEQVKRLEAELAQLKEEMVREQERKRSHDVEATPTAQQFASSVNLGLGLDADEPGNSLGSRPLDIPVFSFTVHEDDEEYYSEDNKDDDDLDRYEDDYDEEFDDSVDDLPPPIPRRSTEELRDSVALSSWSFPKAQPGQMSSKAESQDVDRFFNCLDESDTSDDSDPASPVSFNYEHSKDIFASGFQYAGEDDAPFFFPPGIGTAVEEPTVTDKQMKGTLALAMVTEEDEEEEDDDDSYDLSLDEDDSDMFGEAGGITITFTPPDEAEEQEEEVQQIKFAQPSKPGSPPPILPALDFGNIDEDESEELFSLASISAPAKPTILPAAPSAVLPGPKSTTSPVTPPSSLPRAVSPKFTSPSSIPRPSSRQSSNKVRETPLSPSPPSRVSFGSFNSFATPPSKRGGGSPSFIPQPVTSPSPSRVLSSKPRTSVAAPTFIRPPSRKGSDIASQTQNGSRFSNGSSFAPQPSVKHPSSTVGWRDSILTQLRK